MIEIDKIEKARQVQRDCIESHMIPPALSIITIEKVDKNGNIITSLTKKSESFVFNAYNSIATSICGAGTVSVEEIPTGYGYGQMGTKQRGGQTGRTSIPTISGGTSQIAVGTSGIPDILEDYVLNELITTLTQNSKAVTGSFIDKHLIVTHTQTFINTTTDNIIIREAGFYTASPTSVSSYLMLRDIFPDVSLSQFEGITITYTLEMIYP